MKLVIAMAFVASAALANPPATTTTTTPAAAPHGTTATAHGKKDAHQCKEKNADGTCKKEEMKK